jgi:ATP/maltotriose-dependent transcriptional regulator MalT
MVAVAYDARAQLNELSDALDSGNAMFNRYIYDQPDSALAYARSNLDLTIRLDCDSCRILALNQIGSAYWSQGQLTNALKYLDSSLELSEQLSIPSMKAKNLANIGNIFSASDQKLTAINYYHQALVIQKRLNNQFRIFAGYNNIGKAYLDISEFDSARYYLKQAEQVIDSSFIHLSAITYFNLAETEFKDGNIDLTSEILDKCIQTARKYEDLRGEIRALQLMAEIDLLGGHITEAMEKSNQSLAFAEQTNSKELIYITLETQSKVLAAIGAHEKAYQAITRAKEFRNLLQGNKVRNQLGLYDYQKEKAQLEVLEERALLNESLADKQRTLITGLIVILILSIVLLLIVVEPKLIPDFIAL